ncbi:P44/Msp2 family outer membrane protein [Wolbachia endosymbiont of Dirofilaria (Dirofilaria) immitis]|uniref:P44/Msp2 family outer membrane protein n=1 Tax=Wolbachia endosymbiont of Dirofilaria (Dirofilaria) immitis TaxID=1812115 RepID=UPI00158D1151|nr:P44/Msp2 family outer membrane protein [Wolbachia endosymbiont of Dirofilaria (Dirofilaria) immitis]QKX02585.1 P44/Msp2 family outer membrane protein [Wolbachia endosymbiont of Dirofilaria (Dirofilaria) immitis]
MIRKSVVFNVLLILHISFLSAQANESYSENEHLIENLIPIEKSICHEPKKYNEKDTPLVKDRKLDFYVSANSGKIYSDNSKPFVNGIKAIGERVFTLVKSRYDAIIKNIVTDKIESVKKFNGEINFQWFHSISLGYYAGKNGRVDFEVAYSKVDIKNGNPSPVFDRSASIFAFLSNVYYNPSIQGIQTAPYIGLGIGPAVFRLRKINRPPQNPMPLNVPWFAYQVKLGINYSIIPEIKSFLGYRYFSIPIPIVDGISTHSIEAGLIFNF